MENQLPNGKKALEEELIRGHGMANQLLEVLVQDKLNTHLEEEGSSKSVLPFVEDLVRKVLCSFTNTLLILNSNNDVSNEVAASITLRDVSSSINCPKLQSVDETCKSPNILNPKSGSGCYKRKSIAPTWKKDSSILIEDGYTWRKYGQKMTQSKYLRSYYRCTHKNDQGCQAIKQVQRIQDNPPLYRTTYYSHHTCKSPMNPEIIVEPFSPSASSILLSFDNNLQSKQENPFSSSILASTKHEPQEVIHNEHSAQNKLSTFENLLFYDYDIPFDYSRNATLLSSTEAVQFENVYEQYGF
ncbi:WRKY DNA-binding transcription factor 70-like [Glycine soja]|uniref:Putative WRKY transcription factor 70 n=1 Tax=Glycine soja TaxID=3848 RepID=A0A445IAG6_GLYSO|nr:WRKY DNA-binding transcription factor 70-like [Glycine soja]RZB83049.1 putative WRKY transcription factor 70 [Glycine soja]